MGPDLRIRGADLAMSGGLSTGRQCHGVQSSAHAPATPDGRTAEGVNSVSAQAG
jgi:hypothetical protein